MERGTQIAPTQRSHFLTDPEWAFKTHEVVHVCMCPDGMSGQIWAVNAAHMRALSLAMTSIATQYVSVIVVSLNDHELCVMIISVFSFSAV